MHFSVRLWTFLVLLFAVRLHASVLTPHVLPLAVRTPYFSAWLRNARDDPWLSWPSFWAGQELGLSILAYVPGSKTVYPLFGKPQDSLPDDGEDGYLVAFPRYHGAQFDACSTNFSYTIPAPEHGTEPLKLTISFLSPITPASTLRQAIPGSYFSIEVEGSFDVDLYTDINGFWVSGKGDSRIQWRKTDIALEDHGSLQSWEIRKEGEELFTEWADRAEWGRLHFTGPAGARFESGSAIEVRRRFAKTGTLQNHDGQEFRNIDDRQPIFAFHQRLHLGSRKTSNKTDVLFTLMHIQDEVTQFASERGLTFMRPLWKSYFPAEHKLLIFHYMDYNTAAQMAGNYSRQLALDANKAGGTDYVDIVSLSARQVLGATSFSGTPDNPLLFLKEISSNGNTQTVDVIFPSTPFFLYTNPRWMAYLLEPLLEHQLSGQYPNKYSMHDLGAHFPNLTGHADGNDEYMPLEECGDMLIMGLSLVHALSYEDEKDAQSIWSAKGVEAEISTAPNVSPFALHVSTDPNDDFGMDNKFGGGKHGLSQGVQWLKNSYRIWKQWTEYLIEEALYPKNQLSTDDFAGWLPLQVNLALKGMIGINAMSELADIVGDDQSVKYYKNISDTYIDKWQDLALSRDRSHAKLAYNWHSSWTTIYSLYSDSLLCFHTDTSSSSGTESPDPSPPGRQKPLTPADVSLNKSKSKNFIPHDLYKNQSHWYALSMQKYGLPLDNRHLYAKSDWQMQAAAVASPSVQKDMIHRMAVWLNESVINVPFTDLYDTETDWTQFLARPVIGSHFSLLALERACGGKAKNGLIWDD